METSPEGVKVAIECYTNNKEELFTLMKEFKECSNAGETRQLTLPEPRNKNKRQTNTGKPTPMLMPDDATISIQEYIETERVNVICDDTLGAGVTLAPDPVISSIFVGGDATRDGMLEIIIGDKIKADQHGINAAIKHTTTTSTDATKCIIIENKIEHDQRETNVAAKHTAANVTEKTKHLFEELTIRDEVDFHTSSDMDFTRLSQQKQSGSSSTPTRTHGTLTHKELHLDMDGPETSIYVMQHDTSEPTIRDETGICHISGDTDFTHLSQQKQSGSPSTTTVMAGTLTSQGLQLDMDEPEHIGSKVEDVTEHDTRELIAGDRIEHDRISAVAIRTGSNKYDNTIKEQVANSNSKSETEMATTMQNDKQHETRSNSSDYHTRILWTQENEETLRILNEQNGTQYYNHHNERGDEGYTEAMFLARVVSQPPNCGCQWKKVYALMGNTSLGVHMQRVAETREFTSWGYLRWRTRDKGLEEILLGDCEMVRLRNTPDPRAVVWGGHLSLLVFGITPLKREETQWQIIASEGMVRLNTTDTHDPDRHVWFTKAEMPLRNVVPFAIDQSRNAEILEDMDLDELYGFNTLFGPELAITDAKQGFPAQREYQPVQWQQTCSYTTNSKGERKHYISCEASSQMILIPVDQTATNTPRGTQFKCTVWNPQSLGGKLVDKTLKGEESKTQLERQTFSKSATELERYIQEQQPDVMVMPEAAIPSQTYRTSNLYEFAAQQLAAKYKYRWLCAHHITGRAQKGIAMLIKQDLVIHEVSWGLDIDGRRQWEGRVLAVRFTGFWLLGVYMPHKETHYRLLLHQITAWIKRTQLPVLMCGDMNTVLDEIKEGVRVHDATGTPVDNSAFLSRIQPEWKMLSQERREMFCSWMKHNQLQDVTTNANYPRTHTCYFRAQAIMRNKTNMETGNTLNKKKAKAAAYLEGQALVTARIDSFFTTARLTQADKGCFRIQEVSNKLNLQKGSPERQHAQAMMSGMQSDHIPVTVTFETLREGVFARTDKEPKSKIERGINMLEWVVFANMQGHTPSRQHVHGPQINILVDHASKIPAGLVLMAREVYRLRRLVQHWCATLKEEGKHRRRWQRIVATGVNIILLRHWRFQELLPVGQMNKTSLARWTRLTRTARLEQYSQHVCNWAQTCGDSPRCPSADALTPWIREIRTQAVLFRLWSMTANIIRKQRKPSMNNDKHEMRLWPKMHIANSDDSWPLRTLQLWVKQRKFMDIHKGLRQWYEGMRDRENPPRPRQEHQGIREHMSFDRAWWWGLEWGANSPLALRNLGMLLPIVTCQRKVEWRTNASIWYKHRGLAGNLETQLYIWALTPQEMITPSTIEHNDTKAYTFWWNEWRKAAMIVLSNKGDCKGDTAQRNAKGTVLQEVIQQRERCCNYLQVEIDRIKEQSVPEVTNGEVIEGWKLPSQTVPPDYINVLAEDVWWIPLDDSRGELRLTQTEKLSRKRNNYLMNLMEKLHREDKPRSIQEDAVFVDCQKSTEGSALTYTSGNISITGADTQSLYCVSQLWDSGSDFNVVAVWLLVRLLGSRWREYVQPLPDAKAARMATGHLAQALGTVVIQMDWTVAPDDNNLRYDMLELNQCDIEPFRVIRIPIRFLVFDNFEIPLILGMPTIGAMSAGLQIPEYDPWYVSIYNRPKIRGDTQARRRFRLPLRPTGSKSTNRLLVCCLEKGQWIRSDYPMQVMTRINGGGAVCLQAHYDDVQGWNHEEKGVSYELQYLLEGVQDYHSLYSAERRFQTFSQVEAIQPREGTAIPVMIQAIPCMAGEEGTQHQAREMAEAGAPEGLDMLAYQQPHGTHGKDPVYLPAGTPVAWLEMQAKDADIENQSRLNPIISPGFKYIDRMMGEYGLQDGVFLVNGEEYSHRLAKPDAFAEQICCSFTEGGEVGSTLDQIWEGTGSYLKARRWMVEVFQQIAHRVTMQSNRIDSSRLIRNLWRLDLYGADEYKATCENIKASVRERRTNIRRAAAVMEWLRHEDRRVWLLEEMKINDQGIFKCPFRALWAFLGLTTEPLDYKDETTQRKGLNSEQYRKADDQLEQLIKSLQGIGTPDTKTPVIKTEKEYGYGKWWCNTSRISILLEDVTTTNEEALLDRIENYLESNTSHTMNNTDNDNNWLCYVRNNLPPTTQEKEALDAATIQRQELQEMLEKDSAFQNPLESILEDEIRIPDYMCHEDFLTQIQGGRSNKVSCEGILELINEEWRQRIRNACSKQRMGRNGKLPDQQQRESRFAGYVASIELHAKEYPIERRERILECVCKFEGLFNCDPNIPPEWTGGEPYAGLKLVHESPPIRHQERRIPPLALPIVLKQIREWLEAGIVEPSTSPHASPLLIVAKKALAQPRDPKTGVLVADWVPKPRWRCCVDYKEANARQVDVNMSNAPKMEECLHHVASCGGRLFDKQKAGTMKDEHEWLATTADLLQGFHQMRLAPECRPLTAFTVPGLHTKEGRLQFVCAPFGLAVMPIYFHECVGQALGDLRYGNIRGLKPGDDKLQIPGQKTNPLGYQVVSHYIDDIITSTCDTFEDHMRAVELVFERLEAVGFGARVDKVEFAKPRLDMLGWSVSAGQIRTNDFKVKKMIDEIGGPECRLRDKKEVQSALGALNFYRSVIPNAGSIAAPLYKLTKKGAFENAEDWTTIHTAALAALKTALLKDTFLAVPRENEEFILVTDASVHSGAAVLAQVQADGSEHPVAYAGTSFPEPMRRWSPSERECFTLLWGADYFAQYLKFGKCVFCTDHAPIVALAKATTRSANSKLARWMGRLSQWTNAKVVHRAGVTIGLADTLSRLLQGSNEETIDNHDNLKSEQGPLETIETTDCNEAGAIRLYGAPLQRLSMLKPPTNQVWQTAKEAYQKAGSPQDQPVFHDTQMLNQANEEVKATFQKRKDWFQPGQISPDQAVRILEVARKQGSFPGISAAELSNGKYYVAHITDTSCIDEAYTGDDALLTRRAGGVDAQEGVHAADFVKARHGMPTSVLVWTTLAEATVQEIIRKTTGHEMTVDETDFLCTVEDGWDSCQRQRISAVMEEDSDYDYEEEDLLRVSFEDADGNPLPREWITGGCISSGQTPNTSPSRVNVCGEACQGVNTMTSEANVCGEVPTPRNESRLPEPWEKVRQKAMRITQEMWTQRQVNKGVLSEEMTSYIMALCDPTVTTILCQGGPGSGKTFTATLVAMLALCAGVTTKVLHTKPLVSAGGVGLGFERGTTADKLQYWLRPTKMAMERVIAMEHIDPQMLEKAVESYPIDRTRGLSLPKGEWLIADEMQNCQHSLLGCVATRAETGSKVVMCGDIEQMDIPTTKGKPGGMQTMVQAWTLLQSQSKNTATSNEVVAKAKWALTQLEGLNKSFRMVDLGRQCNVRDSQNSAFTNWVMDLAKSGSAASTAHINVLATITELEPNSQWGLDNEFTRDQVKKMIDDDGTPDKTGTMIPFFSAFAGLNNLGCGLARGIPQMISVGGSEVDAIAQEAYRRRHGYKPFTDQTRVAPHSLKGVYVLGSGAPCVAYSPAGAQKGTMDPRGLHYVDQVDTYIEAKIPILVLEQVPECQNILKNDYRAQLTQKSPHTTMIAKLRAAGYHVPQHTRDSKSTDGILIRATDVGGVVDRERLITVAVREEIWDESKFQWPDLEMKSKRTVRSILDKQPEEKYLCREDNSIRFERAERPPEPGRAWIKWFKKGVHRSAMGEWTDPHKIYSIDGPMPSPTAYGNTRWFEYEGPNQEQWRRRLSPTEVARALGVETRLITNFGERSAYRLVGNAVAIEVGQAIGGSINKLIDRDLALTRMERWLQEYEMEVPRMNPKSEDQDVQEDSLRREMMYRIRNAYQNKAPRPGVYSIQASGVTPLHDWIDTGLYGNESVDWETVIQDNDIGNIIHSHNHHRSESTPRINSLPEETISGQIRIKTPRDAAYAREQEQCLWCHGLRQYITTRKHPPNEDSQQTTEREKEAHHYCMFQGLLYRKNDREDGPGLQLCTPAHLRDTVVRMAHNSPVAIHPSGRQMSRMIARRHYWPTIDQHCTRIRAECETCAKAGAGICSDGDQVHYVPIGKPLSVVAIDVVGPMGNKNAVTSRGNRYLVTIIDWFTRYVCMFPIAEPTAAAIGQCLAKFTERFGVPSTVVSDGASYFRADSIREYERMLGIRRGYVAEYRAPGNGLLERFHRTLGRQMKIRVHESGTTDWDENCGLMSFAYNSMEHSATGYSPFYLMHGYHPAMPFDVIDPVEEDGFVSKIAWVTEQQRRLNEAHTLAYERMQDAAYARLSRSTAKIKEVFKTGDQVYLWIPAVPRGFAKKCTLQWHGPFEVVSEKKGRSYMIRTHRTARLIHEARLKRAVKGTLSEEHRIVDKELQQEFEELLDHGAAIDHDPGWQVVASILNEGPLETKQPGMQGLVWLGFEDKPYTTIQQRQDESKEPRMDISIDGVSRELELTDSIREAMTNLYTTTVEYCLCCQKERLPGSLKYISVCQECNDDLQVKSTSCKAIYPGVWYRVAADACDKIPCGMKVRDCVMCHKTPVFVSTTELRRYCRFIHKCVHMKTAMAETNLMDTERYFRIDRTFGETEVDTMVDVITRYPSEIITTDMDTESPTTEALVDLELVVRSESPMIDCSIDRVCGYQVRGRQYMVAWSDKSKSWVTVMNLIQSPSATAAWLTSTSGRQRIKKVTGEDFNYTNWSHFIRTTSELLTKEIYRVISIQLTHTKQKNWATIKSSSAFRNGTDAHARFSVWLIPVRLQMTDRTDDIVIPMTEITLRTLKQFFDPVEWASRWADIHKRFNAIAMGHPTVPIYWCHKDDETIGLAHEAYDMDKGLSTADVFSV